MNKYLSFFLTSAKHTFANKANLVGNIILLIIILFIYNQLWTVVGKGSNQHGLNSSFIWYLLMGELIILSTSRTERQIEDDIKTGTMSYYLNKPISFFAMRFMEATASTSVLVLSMIVVGGAFVYLITPSIPFLPHQFPIIIFCVYLSCIFNVLLFIAMGYTALWLNEVKTATMAVQRLAFVFGGAIFPLSIYPEWLVNIAKCTPFYSMYYLTMKLIYDFSWENLAIAMSLNFLWVSLIGIFLFFAYKKLSKRIEINGG